MHLLTLTSTPHTMQKHQEPTPAYMMETKCERSLMLYIWWVLVTESNLKSQNNTGGSPSLAVLASEWMTCPGAIKESFTTNDINSMWSRFLLNSLWHCNLPIIWLTDSDWLYIAFVVFFVMTMSVCHSPSALFWIGCRLWIEWRLHACTLMAMSVWITLLLRAFVKTWWGLDKATREENRPCLCFTRIIGWFGVQFWINF